MRDEDDGELWTPTALPIREEASPYVVRHGQGYSRFEHISHGIALELLQYVPLDDPIKISRLKITQSVGPIAAALGHRLCGVGAGHVPRRLGAVRRDRDRSGDRRDARAQSLEHRVRHSRGVRRSRRTATVLDRRPHGILGRNGTLDRPAALAGGTPLSNRVGARPRSLRRAADHARARARGATEIVFFLGEAATKAEALSLDHALPNGRSRRRLRRGDRGTGTTSSARFR